MRVTYSFEMQRHEKCQKANFFHQKKNAKTSIHLHTKSEFLSSKKKCKNLHTIFSTHQCDFANMACPPSPPLSRWRSTGWRVKYEKIIEKFWRQIFKTKLSATREIKDEKKNSRINRNVAIKVWKMKNWRKGYGYRGSTRKGQLAFRPDQNLVT